MLHVHVCPPTHRLLLNMVLTYTLVRWAVVSHGRLQWPDQSKQSMPTPCGTWIEYPMLTDVSSNISMPIYRVWKCPGHTWECVSRAFAGILRTIGVTPSTTCIGEREGYTNSCNFNWACFWDVTFQCTHCTLLTYVYFNRPFYLTRWNVLTV